MSQKIVQKNMILVGIILCAAIVSYQYFHTVQVRYLSITSFKACVDAGFKVTRTYPETCVMPGKSFRNELQNENTAPVSQDTTATTTGADFRNLAYSINQQKVLLVDGKSGLGGASSTKELASTFIVTGEPFIYDINGDQKEDVVFLLKMTKDQEKQATYYIASAIALNTGYSGTNALYVDTNILSSAFLYKNGEIVLGYTTKEATTTLKEKHFVFTNDILKQIIYK